MAPRIRVLYWEGSGIRFSRSGSGPGPGLCGACGEVVDAFKSRLDNMQSSLRMCLDTAGEHFREEVVDFVCLSPSMCLEYRLRQFQLHMTLTEGQTLLSERTVIGGALRVSRGQVRSEESGIAVTELGPRDAVRLRQPHEGWLRDYLRDVRAAAHETGGLSIGVMLDKHGMEVNSFGVPAAMFARAPERPISEVVILLGGPSGIEDAYLPGILQAFEDRSTGLDLETMKVRLPGGLQHSYVALGDLLGLHDRGFLLPILEDCRMLRMEEFRGWHRQLSSALSNFAASHLDLASKKEVLERLASCLPEAGARPPVPGAGPAGDAPPAPEVEVEAEAEAEAAVTPLDVERRLARLEAHGWLPRRRPWRARQCVRALEPHRVLAAVRRLEGELRGPEPSEVAKDPWGRLAELIDEALQASSGPCLDATEWSVRERAAKARRRVTAHELAALRRLPCREAVRLLDHHVEVGLPEGSLTEAAAHQERPPGAPASSRRAGPGWPGQWGPAAGGPPMALGRPVPTSGWPGPGPRGRVPQPPSAPPPWLRQRQEWLPGQPGTDAEGRLKRSRSS